MAHSSIYQARNRTVFPSIHKIKTRSLYGVFPGGFTFANPANPAAGETFFLLTSRPVGDDQKIYLRKEACTVRKNCKLVLLQRWRKTTHAVRNPWKCTELRGRWVFPPPQPSEMSETPNIISGQRQFTPLLFSVYQREREILKRNEKVKKKQVAF